MADLDRRTRAAQAALETKSAILADLGGEEHLSTLEKTMAENAAMAAAVLVDSHVRWLQGQPVPVAELATLTNAFNRTAQALGLSRRSKDVTVNLDAYLKKKGRCSGMSDDVQPVGSKLSNRSQRLRRIAKK